LQVLVLLGELEWLFVNIFYLGGFGYWLGGMYLLILGFSTVRDMVLTCWLSAKHGLGVVLMGSFFVVQKMPLLERFLGCRVFKDSITDLQR